MPSRRSFISVVAAAAGLAGLGGDPPAAAAAPKGPSQASLAYAKSLQKAFPKAQLTDELVHKIAGDIDGYAPVAADFRRAQLQNSDEPDFTFVAGPAESSR